MIRRILLYGLLAAVFAGCTTTSTRDRAFTDDWADRVRKNPPKDRRVAPETEPPEEQRLGPLTVIRDEQGRPKVNVGRRTGLGADVDYRGGPSGRVRYRYEWDFVKPQRNR